MTISVIFLNFVVNIFFIKYTLNLQQIYGLESNHVGNFIF